MKSLFRKILELFFTYFREVSQSRYLLISSQIGRVSSSKTLYYQGFRPVWQELFTCGMHYPIRRYERSKAIISFLFRDGIEAAILNCCE